MGGSLTDPVGRVIDRVRRVARTVC